MSYSQAKVTTLRSVLEVVALFICGLALVATSKRPHEGPDGTPIPLRAIQTPNDGKQDSFCVSCNKEDGGVCPNFFVLGGGVLDNAFSRLPESPRQCQVLKDSGGAEILLHWPELAVEIQKSNQLAPVAYIKVQEDAKALAELGFVVMPVETLRKNRDLQLPSSKFGTAFFKSVRIAPVQANCVSLTLDPGIENSETKISIYFYLTAQGLGSWLQWEGGITSKWSKEDWAGLNKELLLENLSRFKFWNEDLSAERALIPTIKQTAYGIFVQWPLDANVTIDQLKLKPVALARDEAESRPEMSPVSQICVSDTQTDLGSFLVLP